MTYALKLYDLFYEMVFLEKAKKALFNKNKYLAIFIGKLVIFMIVYKKIGQSKIRYFEAKNQIFSYCIINNKYDNII